MNNSIIIYSGNDIGKYKEINFNELEDNLREMNNKDIIYIDTINLFFDNNIEKQDNLYEKKMKDIRIIELFLNSLKFENNNETNSVTDLYSLVFLIDLDLFESMFNLSVENKINVITLDNLIFIGVDDKKLNTNLYLLHYLFYKFHNNNNDILLSNDNEDWLYKNLDMKFNDIIMESSKYDKFKIKNVKDLVTYFRTQFPDNSLYMERDDIKEELIITEKNNNLFFIEDFYNSINININ
jgi:hypothetical protein